MVGLRSTLFGIAALVAVVATPSSACADDDPEDSPALRYVGPAPKAYLRTALEEVGILAAGLYQYFHTSGNSADWDLPYNWSSLAKKLDGQAISFDTNRYDTNWLTHPASGWMFYTAARGNRLSVGESLLVTVGSSTLWEFLGEYREQVSINDMIVTPMSGAVVGEATTQLAAWLDRGDPHVLGQLFSWLLFPFGKVHDLADGVQASKVPAERGYHEFRVTLGAASTRQTDAPTPYLDATVALQTRIFRAPRYGEAGVVSRWLTDGNRSTIGLSATLSRGEFVDARVDADVAFAGYYSQNVRAVPRGRSGYGTYVGAIAGFRYNYHEFDRANGGRTDRLSEVDLGLVLEHRLYFGPLTVQFELTTAPVFAGPTSHAIGEYVARHPPEGLPSVLRDQGYYFAGGGTLAPSLALSWGPLAARGDARISAYRGIAARDRVGALSAVHLSDEARSFGLRLSGRAGPVELGASMRYRLRESRIDDVATRLTDSSWMADSTFVF